MNYRSVRLKVDSGIGIRAYSFSMSYCKWEDINLPYNEIWEDGDMILQDKFETLKRKYSNINK